MLESKKKKLWKNVLQHKYAVEKIVDSKNHELKMIGDLKTTLQYIKDLKKALKSGKVITSNTDLILKIPGAIKAEGLTEKDTEIYFGFMNDKHWYPKDATDKDAIETYFFDTIVIKCTNQAKLERLLLHFDYDWDEKDRMISKLTGKPMEKTFDEIDLVDFPALRHMGKKEALRLWLD